MMYKTMTQTMYGTTKTFVIRDNGNGSFTSFSDDPANTDYQAYLAWCAEGNVPLAADVLVLQENGDTFTLSL